MSMTVLSLNIFELRWLVRVCTHNGGGVFIWFEMGGCGVGVAESGFREGGGEGGGGLIFYMAC